MLKPLLLAIAMLPFYAVAQTQPAPQPMPYSQDFSTLAHTDTVLPSGWIGWSLSGAPSGAFNILPPAANKPLSDRSTASTTANGVHNYNGKPGLLNSGSVDNSLALAVSTLGNTNVRVAFRAGTLRNPYDGNTNTRINELTLQYRVGATGNFANTGVTYQNNTVTQTTSGLTEPQNPILLEALLPAICDDQPVVQLRWVNRQIGGAGSRPSFCIDDVAVTGNSGDVAPPVIAALAPVNGGTDVRPGSSLAITFDENVRKGAGSIIVHSGGVQQTIDVQSPSVTIAGATVRFSAVLRGDRSYYITLDSNTIQDFNGNAFPGIRDTSVWHFATGPQLLDFDFTDCGVQLSDGFSHFSVTGAQTWACTTFGQSGSGVQINGFASGSARDNEDWLISPAFDLRGFAWPLLAFSSRTAFNGPMLELRVSTNYSGSGDPRLAGWTTVNGRFPEAATDVWTASQGINLADFKGSDVYLAWVYTSSPDLQAARWTIDDIHLTNAAAPPPPTITTLPSALDFDYVKAGQHSEPQPILYWGNDLTGPLQVTAPAGFTISPDKQQYFTALTLQDSGPDTLWVRFSPSAADVAQSGTLRFTSTGLNAQKTALSGTSLRSLKVVNWNMEWFGHLDFGPTDEALQQANALKVMRHADADIFALCEVVDTIRLKAIVDAMPGYKYVVSDFGSRVDSLTAPKYDSAQKLAFVYRDSLVRNIRTYGVLRRGGSTQAYFNWSSGRFPYLMETDVMFNGDTARVHFIVIHAKANTGEPSEKIESWHRRKDGAKELKDTLDAHFPYKNVLVLGDFNDDFDRTITNEMNPDTTTSYIDFKLDPADYTALTYPLSLARQRSTASFSDMIDHAMGTNELRHALIPQSPRVLRSVEALIPSYATRTSDHFPVVTRYDVRILAHPVVTETFTAKAENGGVALRWQTLREINNARFVIERSRNQRNFEPVDTIPSAAVDGEGLPYLYQDDTVLPGRWHYRLKQISLDGSVQYQPAQSVLVLSREAWFRLLCVLIGRQLYVYMESPVNGPGYIQLIDMQGSIRYQGVIQLQKGRNLRTIDVGNLGAGVYLVRVESGDKTEVKKVFISRW